MYLKFSLLASENKVLACHALMGQSSYPATFHLTEHYLSQDPLFNQFCSNYFSIEKDHSVFGMSRSLHLVYGKDFRSLLKKTFSIRTHFGFPTSLDVPRITSYYTSSIVLSFSVC